jgi:hypothetical protein
MEEGIPKPLPTMGRVELLSSGPEAQLDRAEERSKKDINTLFRPIKKESGYEGISRADSGKSCGDRVPRSYLLRQPPPQKCPQNTLTQSQLDSSEVLMCYSWFMKVHISSHCLYKLALVHESQSLNFQEL